MLKSDFNKVAKQLIEITLPRGCSPVNLLHTFRITVPRITHGGLLLDLPYKVSEITRWFYYAKLNVTVHSRITIMKSLKHVGETY